MHERLGTSNERQTVIRAAALVIFLMSFGTRASAASAAEYYAAGEKVFKAGDYAKAAQYLNAALKLDPKHKNAYYLLGNAYYKQGNAAAAIIAFKSYLRLDPDNTQVQAFLSRLESSGGAAAGGTASGQSLRQAPNSAQATSGGQGKWGGPSPKRAKGTVVVYDERFPFGVKQTVAAKGGIIEQGAAFGRHCLRYEARGNKGEVSIAFQWNKAWEASGVPRPGDLSDYRDSGALVFWLKGKQGGEMFQVSLANPPEREYGYGKATKGGRFRNTVGGERYVDMSTDWQKVVIPLSDFHKKGALWGRYKGGRTTHQYNEFNWLRVDEIRFKVGETRPKGWTLFIDELLIVPSYDKAAAKALKEKARKSRYARAGDSQGNLILFDDKPNASYYSAWPGPHARLVLDETTRHGGKKSFHFVMDTRKWSWCSFGIENLDLKPFVKRGFLEFWLKGERGNENFILGFQCTDQSGYTITNALNSSSFTNIKTEWRKVKVELADFGLHGKGPGNRKMLFDWRCIHQFYVQGPPRKGGRNAFWMDDIKVMKKRR